MTTPSLKDSLRTAELLVGPNVEGGTGKKEVDAASVIRARLERAGFSDNERLQPATNYKGRFALACLQCLLSVNQLITLDESEVGAGDLRLLDTLLQVVVFLGVYPLLQPNVGLPIAARTRYTMLLDFEGDVKGTSNDALLFRISDGLASMVCDERNTVVKRFLVTKYLPDVFAALLQSGYSPQNGASDETQENQSGESSYRQPAAKLLSNVFASASSAHSMEALFSLLRSRPAPWFKARCSHLLSQILLRPTGIRTLFECLLQPQSETGSQDTQQLQKVAQVISSVPKQAASVDEYFSIICPQLLLLLKTADNAKIVSTAAAYVTTHLLSKYFDQTRTYLINPILAPLLAYYTEATDLPPTDTPQDLDGNPILSTEPALTTTILLIRRLLTSNTISDPLRRSLHPVIPPLYDIYAFATLTAAHVRQPVQDILLAFFRTEDKTDASAVLWQTIVDVRRGEGSALKRGGEGGVVMIARPPDLPRAVVDVDAFMEFLALVDNDALVGSLFLRLIEHLGTSDVFESAEDEEGDEGENATEKLLITQLTLALMQTYGDRILTSPSQIILFAKNMLLTSDDESVSLGLALLTAVIDARVDDPESDKGMQPVFDELLTILQTFREHPDESVRGMAMELRVLVVTRASGLTAGDGPAAPQSSAETLQTALKDVGDELLPVRAYGMHVIRNLVLARDDLVADRIGDVTDVFLAQLRDDDSFIYLNAIKGLSALTDAYPSLTLHAITTRYTTPTLPLDYRLRIGEALLQTIQRLGTAFAKYAPEILPPVLRTLHDSHPELRGSALGLLGMLAETSPYALIPYIHQLLSYTDSLLTLETDTAPTRRAAVALLVGLVRGFKGDIVSQVGVEGVRRIKGMLGRCEGDADGVVRGHAGVARGDLEAWVRVGVGL
ncbi:armadillo-type protein [Fimicolochytrium jonesii]|uniref:armadillo-type protein n=1 Tax=Fimicolochytrium jonesii TaxID=1396493 RepID=UPI0022FE33F8|nr:armadillo-type protein [Fimicolochytrium jonesii]KAI8816084.1 armadillo-type protein [Fimicolochytrium jonesii]